MKLYIRLSGPKWSWRVCTANGQSIREGFTDVEGYQPTHRAALRAATMAGIRWLAQRQISGTVIQSHQAEAAR